MSSIQNFSAVLRLFNEQRRVLSVTQVASLLNMPKSTTSRLLRTMSDEGLLDPVASRAGYQVGNLLFQVVRAHRASSSISAEADEVLRGVCEQTGHTGYVASLDGPDLFCLRIRYGSQALRVVTLPGHRSPAFATANGRALLARLPEERVRALHPETLQPPSRHAPQSMTELLAALEVTRERGWAVSHDEAIPSVGSVGVAVGDPETCETVAFCVAYSAHQVGPNEKARIAELLLDGAIDLGLRFEDPFWLHHPATRRRRALLAEAQGADSPSSSTAGRDRGRTSPSQAGRRF